MFLCVIVLPLYDLLKLCAQTIFQPFSASGTWYLEYCQLYTAQQAELLAAARGGQLTLPVGFDRHNELLKSTERQFAALDNVIGKSVGQPQSHGRTLAFQALLLQPGAMVHPSWAAQLPGWQPPSLHSYVNQLGSQQPGHLCRVYGLLLSQALLHSFCGLCNNARIAVHALLQVA